MLGRRYKMTRCGIRTGGAGARRRNGAWAHAFSSGGFWPLMTYTGRREWRRAEGIIMRILTSRKKHVEKSCGTITLWPDERMTAGLLDEKASSAGPRRREIIA